MVMSNDESFVLKILSELHDADGFRMEVFGLPSWAGFKLLPPDLLQGLNVHITNSFWINKSSTEAIQFKKSYQSKYQSNPTFQSVRGYDQLMYFGSLLLHDGVRLDQSFFNSSGNGIGDRFRIEPVTDLQSKSVLYFENKSLFMLHFSGGQWVKEPD
jgi:hypothetical protein